VITFRYHIVSIVSVFLALAVGIVLGSGPLQGREDDTLVNQVDSDRQTKSDLQGEIAGLRAGNTVTDEFAAIVAPKLVGNTLRRRSVVVVVLPTASASDVSALRKLVAVAGGSVGGTVRVAPALVDVSDKQLVDELGTRLAARAPGVRVPASAGPYERMGALVGRAVGAARRGGAPMDTGATSILAGLKAAGLMSTDGALTRRGDLVLFVTGPGQGGSAAQRGASTIVTSLVEAVDGATAGAVLAGPVAAAGAQGQLAAVRADSRTARDVSTVDSLGRTAGQVVTVMALVGQAAGRTGHYGADAPDGAMPGATPPPR
jgi:Copper transport outer membrane protein, MctB